MAAPEDILVGQEPAGAGGQPVQGVRGVVVGPGEAGGVTCLVGVVRAQAGAVLPVRLLGLQQGAQGHHPLGTLHQTLDLSPR